jgi:ABC-type lipoprotein export system ATPase subunit
MALTASAALVARLLAEAAPRDRQTVVCANHDPQAIAHAAQVVEL